MCGHATIALGRFLVDTNDLALFPARRRLAYDSSAGSTVLRLHAPCGIVRVTVPTLLSNGVARSDPSRGVSFLSVPCFAVASGLRVEIPPRYQWPEIRARAVDNAAATVELDIAYGGAFYAIVSASQLGFAGGTLLAEKQSEAGGAGYRPEVLKSLDTATARLKQYIQDTPWLCGLIVHPSEAQMGFLYGVTVVDEHAWMPCGGGVVGQDTNICFFAEQQLDRSPTGSCVCARVAVSIARGELAVGDGWAYHSVVSVLGGSGEGGFVGRGVEKVTLGGGVEGVVVGVEGKAWYTGEGTFVVEEGDPGV